jgi:uncharacterized protein (TIGR02588 family)
MPNKSRKDQGKLDKAPIWMWAIGLLGALLVFGSIGFALYEAAAGDSSPPNVKVEVQSITPVQNGYLVEFRAINEGGRTAAGLTIEGELRNGTEIVESSDTTLDYLPSHSERSGGLFFTADPQEHQLQLRAKGYEMP